jgi:hypothetical protein
LKIINLIVNSGLQFSGIKEIKKGFPHFGYTLLLISEISAPGDTQMSLVTCLDCSKFDQNDNIPMKTNQRDVLEKNSVDSDLFKGTLCKTNHKNTSTPSSALHANKIRNRFS